MPQKRDELEAAVAALPDDQLVARQAAIREEMRSLRLAYAEKALELVLVKRRGKAIAEAAARKAVVDAVVAEIGKGKP